MLAQRHNAAQLSQSRKKRDQSNVVLVVAVECDSDDSQYRRRNSQGSLSAARRWERDMAGRVRRQKQETRVYQIEWRRSHIKGGERRKTVAEKMAYPSEQLGVPSTSVVRHGDGRLLTNTSSSPAELRCAAEPGRGFRPGAGFSWLKWWSGLA